MLKKILASLALVLLLAGSGLAADPIRIGYLVALTGDNGEPFEDNDTVGAPDVPAKEITQ